jgi:hypothetical protein
MTSGFADISHKAGSRYVAPTSGPRGNNPPGPLVSTIDSDGHFARRAARSCGRGLCAVTGPATCAVGGPAAMNRPRGIRSIRAYWGGGEIDTRWRILGEALAVRGKYEGRGTDCPR